DTDVAALLAQGRAVLRPAVFFLTDGAPTDPGWEQSFQRLVDKSWARRPHVITYGFGAAPREVLSKVATKAAFLAENGADQDTADGDADALRADDVTSVAAPDHAHHDRDFADAADDRDVAEGLDHRSRQGSSAHTAEGVTSNRNRFSGRWSELRVSQIVRRG